MRFYVSLEPDKKKLIQKLLKSHGRHVIPDWVSSVHVVFDESLEDYAQIGCEYAYRRLSMDLGPRFFALPHDQQVRLITHEFAHALQAPLIDFIEAMMTPKQRADRTLQSLYEQALEASNDDTAEMLWRLIK